MSRLGSLGRALLSAVVALSLTLPTPALAWATSGGLAAGNLSLGAGQAAPLDVNADVWDGSIDVSWYVEAPDASAYTLSKPAQLAGLAALVNGTSNASAQPLTFKGKTIKLGADIVLNAQAATGYDSTGSQRVWTPIGDLELLSIDPNGSEGAMPHYGDGKYFDGTFDGNGHVVKNIYIYRNEEGTYGGVQALFANVGGNAVIRNVGIDGGYVMGRVAAGLVAISHATEGHFPQIIGCFNTANITGNGSTTRGLAGIFAGEEQYRGAGEGQEENYHGGAIIANCYNAGTITKYSTSSPSAGGIAGTGSVQMHGCYNIGDVNIESRYAGALAGCLVAPGHKVGQGTGAIEGNSAVSDTYALGACIPVDDQGLVKLYNMLDAQHGKGDVGERNPGVTSADKAGFKDDSWFRAQDSWKELSQSYVYKSGAPAPRLYWQEGQSQWNFQAKDDYGFQRYEVWGIRNQPYTGSPLKPAVTVTYSSDGTNSDASLVYLHEGSDYTVSYTNNIEKGTAYVTVTGIGRFYNTQATTFNIIGSSLSEATIQPISAQWWYGDGSVNPAVTVLATNGDALREGTDYTLDITGIPTSEAGFKDGKATATVTVTSADEAKFSGSKTTTFTVLQASTGLGDSDGNGYYEIGSKADLQYLAYASSRKAGNDSVTLWGSRNFELTADIDATAHCDEGDTSYMTDRPADPLFSYYHRPTTSTGDQSRYGGFGGTFDGKGHSITLGQTESGLSLDPNSPLALFVYTKYQGTATFKNLTINGSLYGPSSVASGLLTMAQPGEVTVEDCTNNAAATGNLGVYGAAAGFIVETSSGAGSEGTTLVMRNCTNNGAMSSASRAAGIVGALGGGTSNLENCVNNGAVTASSTGGAGGIVGLVKGADSEANASAEITFDKCSNTGSVTVKSSGDAGGIAGWNQDPVVKISFTRCANTGDVMYAGAGNNGAGIMGRSYSPTSFVNCYNNAKISPRNSNANAPAGILGYSGVRVKAGQDYGDMVFRNVYAAGGFGSQAADAGGIVGTVWLHSRLTFDNCYYETGIGRATKEIGYNWGTFSDTAIAPPIVEGECVQMSADSMKDATFATMLGGAFAPDTQDETGAYANGGYPVLSDSVAEVFNLSDSGAFTVTGDDTLQYSGAQLELPNLAVHSSSGAELVKGTDYIVFYTASGTQGRAIVQGIGSYTGSLEKTFTIVPCDLNRCKGIQVKTVSYTDIAGGQAKQSLTVVNPAGATMAEGVDYEVVYSNNTAPGQAYALVRGLAPYYTGSVLRAFTITPGELGKVKVGGVDAHYPASNATGGLYIYEQLTTPGGYELKRSDSANAKNDYIRVFYEYNEESGEYDLPVKIDGSHDADKAWAYRIEKAGKYMVELRADGTSVNPTSGEQTNWTNGYWTGTASATFTYGNRMESDEDVAVSGIEATYGQTGGDLSKALKPVLVNKHTDYELERNVDYKLTYLLYDDAEGQYLPTAAVTDAGRYKLVITGMNTWFGTREIAFRVVPQQFYIADAAVVEGIDAQYVYTGGAVKPVPTAVKIPVGDAAQARTLKSTDYTVSYTDAKGNAVASPTDEGSYYVVITGAGAYQGSKRVPFSIAKPYLSVYVKAGSGEAKLAKRYTKAQFSALASADAAKNPVSALYCDRSGSNWSVASTNNYVTLPALFANAGVKWEAGVSVSYKSGEFGGATYTYEQANSAMFYPATTAAATSTVQGRKAPLVFSVTDASTSIGGASGTTFAAEAEQMNLSKAGGETAPRAIMGVAPSDYAAASSNAAKMMGSRLVKGVDSVTVILPEGSGSPDGGSGSDDKPAGSDGASSGGKPGSDSASGSGPSSGSSTAPGSASGSAGKAATSKVSIGKATVAVSGATYTGKQLKPAVTVKLAGKKLRAGTDYSVSYSDNVKAGAGMVTVSGKGAYTGSVSKGFIIAKAKNTLTVKAKKKANEVKYVKLAKKNQVIKKSAAFKIAKAKGKVTFKKKSGAKKIVVNKKTGNITVKKGLKKGVYKVKVNVTAKGDANYKSITKGVTLKITVK